MGLQIRTYVNGNQEFIDLYGNENITIEVSFAEIQDIKKKNSAYTQEFKVPGSKNNNFIFNYFFDINTVALDWNPKRKFEADLLYDGYELYNGYVRMNSVTIDKIEKIYSITFYSAVGDLASNIGDKGLCLVDTSSLNHSLYDTTIASKLFEDPSLHPTSMFPDTPFYNNLKNPVSDGDVQYIIGQRGYDYTGSTFGTINDIDTNYTPLLDFSGVTGFFDFNKTPIPLTYLIPSIRTRKLYELIVNQAGYQIESDFFDTDYFGRYYIPLSFNSDQPYMNQSYKYEFAFNNTSGYTSELTTSILETNPPFTNPPVNKPTTFLQAREITKENQGYNPINITQFPSLAAFQKYFFYIPPSTTEVYEYESVISYRYTGPAGPPRTPEHIGNFYLWEVIEVIGGTVPNVVLTNTAPLIADIGSPGTILSETITNTLYSLYPQSIYAISYYSEPGYEGMIEATSLTFDLISSPVILPNTIELFKEMSCEQKQIDFIQNINRQFNLLVIEHPIKPKTLIVEPIVNYIGKGKELDWTDKVDYNSPQNISPTTNIINGSLFLSNTIDKDFINAEYQKKTNQVFGERTIDLGVDYKNTTTNLVQTLGQNTDYYLNITGETNVALPCYFISKENNKNGISIFEYRPFRSLPRNVFKSIPIPRGNTDANPFFYRFNGINIPFTPIGLKAIGTLPNENRLTTYPFALSGFSHYTTYNPNNRFTENELIYPEVESQYDRYYRDYIEDLTSEENKLYSCKMYLKPWEVAQLYYNEVIIIKNAKFRINKITGLSLTNPDLCNVELVKLTRDYISTPTLFYDLIACNDPCNIIHSHTDLSYLLWAFDGRVVRAASAIDPDFGPVEETYKVVRTEFNPDYEYQPVYFINSEDETFSQDGDIFQVYNDFVMFSGCGTSAISNTLNVYNDFTGSTTTCLNILATNTGPITASFTYTSCDGSIITTSLAPSASTTVCAVYGTTRGTTFTFCPTSTTPCT